jgi:hypothetical protein
MKYSERERIMNIVSISVSKIMGTWPEPEVYANAGAEFCSCL